MSAVINLDNSNLEETPVITLADINAAIKCLSVFKKVRRKFLRRRRKEKIFRFLTKIFKGVKKHDDGIREYEFELKRSH